MSLDTLNNGDSGLEARTKINAAIDAIEDSIGLPRSYLAGYTMAYNSTILLNISSGVCRDDTNAYDMVSLGAITKDLSASWVAGTSNGGLLPGLTFSANTNYSVWAIKNTSSGAVDVIVSTAATLPTLPSGYTAKRRIGWVRTLTGSAGITPFVQAGDQVILNTGSSAPDYTGSIPTSSDTLFTVKSPPSVIGLFRLSGIAAGVWTLRLDTTNSMTGVATGASTAILGGNNGIAAYCYVELQVSSSSQLLARAGTTATTIALTQRGWNDTRGCTE